MATFTDSTGRKWVLAVTIGSLKRAKARGVDLLEGGTIAGIWADPPMLCDAVFALVQPQAEAAGVSEDAFFDAMAGAPVAEASRALTEELVLFFRGAGHAAKAQTILKAVSVMEIGLAELAKRIATVDPAAIAASALGRVSTAWPESVESTQDHSL
jgi:hypothetical protein